MSTIYVPSRGPDDWRRFLADPEKQWRRGFSARAAAYSWESVNRLPPEIEALFVTSGVQEFQKVCTRSVSRTNGSLILHTFWRSTALTGASANW